MNFKKETNNLFTAEFKSKSIGDFNLDAELYINDIPVDKDNTIFTVDLPYEEYAETKSSDDILRLIAAETGGRNISVLSIGEIKKITQNSESQGESFKEFVSIYLNSNPLYLLIIIFTLTFEWLLRKRFNLP